MEKPSRLGPAYLLFGTLTLLAFSAWVHWPWLWAENSRLDPISRFLVWSSDVYSVLLLIWLVLRHYLVTVDAEHRASPALPGSRWLIAGLVLAWGTDLAVTLYTAYEESAGHAAAERVTGAITAGRLSRSGQVGYVSCRFQDRGGRWHLSHHQVGLSGVPAPTVRAIQAGAFPLPVQIDYDPRRPERCWIDGFNNEDGNRLHWMSACCLLFQGILVPCSAVVGVWFVRVGSIPLYRVLPFAAAMVPFVLGAACKFLIGEF